jgi:PAS domain S-box-containing protein
VKPAPLPADEAGRLAALRRYGILDTPREAAFDDLAFLAAQSCAAPIALVAFVDAEREWIKASVGVGALEVPRDETFCAHAILGAGTMVVSDVRRDERFADNPFVVGRPGVRFYAGAPLLTPEGHAIGTICVFDVVARELSQAQGRALSALARMTAQQLELRLHVGEGTADVAEAMAERRRIRRRLEETVSLLSSTLEATTDGILVVDPAGRIVRSNRRFAELWRIPEEILASGDDDGAIAFVLDQLADPDAFLAKVRELYDDPEAESEDILRFRDGRVFERYSRPHRIGAECVGRVWSFRDVTRRHRGEAATLAAYRISQAAHSVERLEDLYRAIHEAIRELIPADNFYIALLDRGTETVSFPYFVDQIDPPPAPRPPGRGLTELVLRTGRPRLFAAGGEFDELVAAGEVELVGAPSIDWLGVPLQSDGETFGAVVVQSYTEGVRYRPEDLDLLAFVAAQVAMAIRRKQAEEALVERETRLRIMLSQTPAVLWSTDRDLRFTSSEGSGLAELGLEPGEAVGRTLYDFFSSEEEGLPWITAHRRALDGASETFELPWAERHFAAHVEPLRNADGSVVGAAGVAVDITQRWRLEEQLRQSLKMEAIGRLAGGVAHDFNNLLTSILGYSDLVLGRLPQGDANRNDVEQVRIAGERAASLTQQLLAFSRRQVLEPKTLALNTLVSEAGQMLRRLIGEDVVLDLDLDPAAGSIRADASQILQVVMNLAVNARDAMPRGGRLQIATTRTDLAAARHLRQFAIPAGSYARLSVIDTGSGMDEATLSHVFEPFFTTKAKGHGTGLGLATVYGIVKQSSGYILVESQPNAGARFDLFFPRVAEAPESAAETVASGPRQEGSPTVLLVEDEEGLRALAAKVLAANGYRVLEAADAAEAFEVDQRHEGRVDLLLTDVVMPGLSGRELADRLLARRPDMRVLYVSGYPEETLGQENVIVEGTAFLQKPFTPSTLIRKIESVLATEA